MPDNDKPDNDKKKAAPDNGKRKAKPIDSRKLSLYFPEDLVAMLKHHAFRLDRSLSWVAQQAVRLSLEELKKMPSVNEMSESDSEDETEESSAD